MSIKKGADRPAPIAATKQAECGDRNPRISRPGPRAWHNQLTAATLQQFQICFYEQNTLHHIASLISKLLKLFLNQISSLSKNFQLIFRLRHKKKQSPWRRCKLRYHSDAKIWRSHAFRPRGANNTDDYSHASQTSIHEYPNRNSYHRFET